MSYSDTCEPKKLGINNTQVEQEEERTLKREEKTKMEENKLKKYFILYWKEGRIEP